MMVGGTAYHLIFIIIFNLLSIKCLSFDLIGLILGMMYLVAMVVIIQILSLIISLIRKGIL